MLDQPAACSSSAMSLTSLCRHGSRSEIVRLFHTGIHSLNESGSERRIQTCIVASLALTLDVHRAGLPILGRLCLPQLEIELEEDLEGKMSLQGCEDNLGFGPKLG